ncbi:Uncharacterised protein [Neisseria meningitidis]|nr:Uncharacterised protein [Neisseria meningitidis]
MPVKAFILGGDNRIPQHLWEIADFCKFAPLLPIHTDDFPIRRINSQRHFRLVMLQRIQRRQFRIRYQNSNGNQTHSKYTKPKNQTKTSR